MSEAAPPVRVPRRYHWALLLILPPLLFVAAANREARRVEITHPVIHIPGLPQQFAGLKIAVLADVHRGPFLSQARVREVVARTNEQRPDVIALVGDYTHRSGVYIPQVWAGFAELKAPLGVYAVPGNHDHWDGLAATFAGMRQAGIVNLTNTSHPLERGGQRLFLAGVDDAWAGQPDLRAALQALGPHDLAILLCHNPDYIEKARDPRAKLWLSGHTHGGQVCLVPNRPLLHPSRCGLRYIAGLRAFGQSQIYISRGIGTVTPPLRWNCPAELPIIELQPA